MKTRRLLCALFALLWLGVLPSCVYDGYYGGVYDDYDYGYGYDAPYYGTAGVWSSSYRHGRGYYYGGGYHNVCQVCHHHPCRCRHRGHDHDRHHGANHRRHDHDDDGEKMKLVRYNQGDRRRLPEGYHSAEWYKKRGISVTRNTFRERDGETRGREVKHHRDRDHSSDRRDRDSGRDRGNGDKDKRSKKD